MSSSFFEPPSTTTLGFSTPSAGAMDDVTYIKRLRVLLRDIPKPYDEQASGTGSATKFTVAAPINDDGYFQVLVSSVAIPVVYAMSEITSGNVFVDFDSGMLIFGTAPPSATNNIYIAKTKVQWRDSQLLQALEGGVRALYPRLWRYGVDSTILMAVNQWAYPLPTIFNDDRVQLTGCYVQEIPAATERYRPLRGAYRIGANTIQIPTSQFFSPGASLLIEYMAPYRSLSELDSSLAELPLLYAAAQLLGYNEPRRIRTDQQHTQTGEDASPPGQSTNSGSWFYQRFAQELQRKRRVMRKMPIIGTWQR